jgi:cbb3-type cytochrome oxidase cytochrome c subunit
MNAEKRGFVDFVYNVDKLNIVFALSSVALAISVVWMIWADFDREWKHFQREAIRLDRFKTEVELEAASAKVDKDQLVAIETQAQEVEAAILARDAELQTVEAELELIRGQFYIADQNAKFEKAEYDVMKYEFEEAQHSNHTEEAAEKAKSLAEIEERMAEFRLVKEEVESRQVTAKAKFEDIAGKRAVLEGEKAALLKDTALLERRLKGLLPTFENDFRNMPMLDFISPTVKIRQVVLGNLKNDINFITVPKVDRCNTCHVNIDRKGYEIDWETATFQNADLAKYMNETYGEDERIGMTKVLASHPDLDVFMTSGSPHPIDSAGCTSCHQGRDRGVTFVNTAHTPSDAEEAARWEKLYHYHPMHHWDYPMYPSKYVEQSCSSCHQGVVDVPKADELNRGIHLVKTLGCAGCHKIQGYTDLRNVGPDLSRVSAKLGAEWMEKWIRDPRGFRPTTKMPKIFDLPNVNSSEDIARATAAIHGMTQYLLEHSEEKTYTEPPVSGDAERGQSLVEKTGCKACHVVGDGDDYGQQYGLRNFGPNLNDVGSKLSEGWLFEWVKNPEQYFPETMMPNLRLTDQESADIVAYLMTRKNTDFENRRPASVDRQVRDDMALDFLKTRMPVLAAQDSLSSMSDHAKDLFVGERMILKQGCFGCHTIPGFEDATPIGTELTLEGSKNVGKLDFALNPTNIPHTRHDWFFTKLKQPRVFDEGKVRAFADKLRMPHFGLNDEDAHSITLGLLSMSKTFIESAAMRHLSPAEIEIEKGRRHVYERNCKGCHIVEGEGGDIRDPLVASYVADGQDEAGAVGFVPPILNGEGAKVQPDWLFKFLKEVTPIRPWLDVRMPAFGLSDPEAIDITTYFARLDEQQFPYQTVEAKHLDSKQIQAGEMLFSADIYNCWTCHQQGSIKPKGDPASYAPDLTMAKERLKPEWMSQWLWDPQQLAPGTKMPTFFGDELTYLPDGMAKYLSPAEGTTVEYGVMQSRTDGVIQAINDYIIYGLHQNVRLSQR